MRKLKPLLLLLPSLASIMSLTGCGPAPDVTDNVPVAGSWSDTVSLIAISSDQGAMTEEDLPDGFPKPGTKKVCGEPKLRNQEEMREILDAEILLKCKVSEFQKNGDHVTMSATCSPKKQKTIESEMAMDVQAVEAPSSVTIDLTANIYATAPDGEMASMEVVYRREMIRVGDC